MGEIDARQREQPPAEQRGRGRVVRLDGGGERDGQRGDQGAEPGPAPGRNRRWIAALDAGAGALDRPGDDRGERHEGGPAG